MNQDTLLPDDPRITAYVLGELDPDQRAAFETALQHSPAARAAAEEIRATVQQLTNALAAETAQENAAPAAVPTRTVRKSADEYHAPHAGWWARWFRFPRFYYLVGGLAAACFAVMVTLRQPAFHPAKPNAVTAEKVYTTVVDLSAVPPAPDTTTTATETMSATQTEPAVTAPAMVAAKPELQLAGGALPTVPPNLPLLDQIKVEHDARPAKDGRAPLVVLAPTDPAAGSQTFVAKEEARTAAQPTAPVLAKVNVMPAEKGAVLAAAASRKVAKAPPSPDSSETTIQLSPFEVSASGGKGYAARDTLAGSRVNSTLSDIGGSVAVVTKKQFAAGAEVNDVFRYENNAEGQMSFRTRTPPSSTESYSYQGENDFLAASENPLSTFAVDVDTASYANVRRFILGGQRPPVDAVRIEELVNYFPYQYPQPEWVAVADKSPRADMTGPPFAASLEVASAPWAPAHRLVRIGLKGREVSTAARPAANLVFLLDVSGSMNEPNKLPLVKESMRLLVGKLRGDDRVAIVTYAGQSGLALPSTPASKSREILEALDALTPGGSTNGSMGIQLAYDIAKANLVPGGLNRVVLCTDGDFNVGMTSEGALTRLVEEKAKSGVFLTVLGFGMGNLKDATLEKLADKGNGNYGYIDSRREAEKLLVEQVNGTLLTIAKDVKVQVDFNPAKVSSYRLIGYENRLLRKEDFNNDKIDAGEIGAGHTVTALYEIVPVGAEKEAAALPSVDPSKYQTVPSAPVLAKASGGASAELLTVKVRYKEPTGDVSRKLDFPLVDRGGSFDQASADFKFAGAVAAFGMILRDSAHKGSATLADVIAWASAGLGEDPGGYRGDFISVAVAARPLLR